MAEAEEPQDAIAGNPPPVQAAAGDTAFIASTPWHFRAAQGLIGLVLLALIVLNLTKQNYGTVLFFTLALVGLLRRVRWGRFLVSFIGVSAALLVTAAMVPFSIETAAPRGLTHLLGYTPPTWLGVLIIIGMALVILLPLVVIGWRKDYFRPAWW